jgi:hypothetical protein
VGVLNKHYAGSETAIVPSFTDYCSFRNRVVFHLGLTFHGMSTKCHYGL